MPFALIIIGVVLLIAGIRGQLGNLASLIKSDFTGSGNYIYWVVAILVVGSIGYVKKLQPISDAFLALVLIVLMLANKGFFSQFMSGLSATASCSSGSSTDSTTQVMANQYSQAVTAAPTVLYQPGQTLQQQLQGSLANLNSALNTGAGYLGD
jgi:hypothetical protein